MVLTCSMGKRMYGIAHGSFYLKIFCLTWLNSARIIILSFLTYLESNKTDIGTNSRTL